MKIVLVTLILLVLTGCGGGISITRDNYFGGDVTVQYQLNGSGSDDDYIVFTFYEPGTYQISFSITPGTKSIKRGAEYLPKDLQIEITKVPREYLVKQYILPAFLRIKIERGDLAEYHDF